MGKDRTRIIVAEDDRDIQDILTYNFSQEGFETKVVSHGAEVVGEVLRVRPQIVVLDLMLPGESGLEICKRLRADSRTKSIPIIILTARGTESDKVVGLELGADDYVTKPFSPKELVARVRATLRRSQMQSETKNLLKQGGLEVDISGHRVLVDGQEVGVTLSEYKLLKELISQPGHVLSRQNLTQNIMGDGVSVTDRTIDVHLAALRKKIGPYADWIETVRGVGYKFRA
jgi:two-component system phosphate regulon response regulator PhoB